MPEPPDESNETGRDAMHRAVRLREARTQQWRKEGERPLWQNLSMIGVLGWLVVIPTLLGVLVGRWLDGVFDTGLTFSGAMLIVGLSIGCYLAWQRISGD